MNDLKKRIMFVIIILIMYRIGAHIPIPLIDAKQILNSFSDINKNIFNLFALFSGGALTNVTIFSLGIMPYISSSIIIQLLATTWTPLKKIQKDGYSGKKKISLYTRILTLFLSSIQSIAMTKFILNTSIIENYNKLYYIVIIVTLISGTMILMWLGEQINERGIGNGISLIIFTNIISNTPHSINVALEKLRQGEISIFTTAIFIFSLFLIIIMIVTIESSQRKILINYPKRQYGKKIYAAQTNYLPFKINMAGIMPPIFASSIILFPLTAINWINNSLKINFIDYIIKILTPGSLLYIIIFGLLIIFFAFFYTNLIFNSKETAENLKKTGGFISGIRPGEQTAEYIKKIINKLTYLSAIYLTLVCLIPEILTKIINVPFYFGGTSLLIVIAVIIDFISQIQSKLISQKYEKLIKKYERTKF